jgi:hypothetical protein
MGRPVTWIVGGSIDPWCEDLLHMGGCGPRPPGVWILADFPGVYNA